ncbi:PLD nuclease N-terminal domain-containing protein [Kocuria sp.]|uniref:PLD nuclease N-terminal domain-containing protein n=1 Tax=Kocuria sp. TaxID=1871328 RepID=UPI0026DF6B5F|nr:PLDc N-terminal domain-containing protein [Kocuria sp.]MDO5617489.1 PLDc N-terminal domain-containing protein [Kocuria sp.]
MIRAIAIIGAAALAVGVIIYSFFDCLRSDPRDVRGIKRGPWIAVILLLPVIGGILWLTLGRPRYAPPSSQPSRGKGPDDDPNFLRQLDEKRRSEQADAQLEEWEKRRQAGGAAGAADSTEDTVPQQENNSNDDGGPGSVTDSPSDSETRPDADSTTPDDGQDPSDGLPGDEHPDDPHGRPRF